MLCVPWARVAYGQGACIWPETLTRVTVAHSVVLVVVSVKVTVPVGSTLVPTGLTVAVKVTCCPSSEGLPEVCRPTVTPALFTVTVLGTQSLLLVLYSVIGLGPGFTRQTALATGLV